MRSKKLLVVILDDWAGPSFIRFSKIPQAMGHRIRKLDSESKIRNASGKADPIVGIITFTVQSGTIAELVTVLVAYRLITCFILDCDFSYQYVISIKTSLAIVEIDEWYTVHIVWQRSKTDTHVHMQEGEQFSSSNDRFSPRIKTSTRVRLKPATHIWIKANTGLHRTIFVHPY